jgi:DNA mismatch repair ATPase MutS
MNNVSIDKVIYLFFTFALYLLQIYQNAVQCHRFYLNVQLINNHLQEMRAYCNYSIQSMETFISINANKPTYHLFCSDVQKNCETLKKFNELLHDIKPFSKSFSKIGEMGYLLQCFYELHANIEYEEAISYSFCFEGYIDNLKGVAENLQNNVISYAEFDTDSNCKMVDQYYPPLIGENPVKNNCSFSKNIIISSPNAGGKTTMIKTTTINIIFSQQLGCGFYKSCVLNPYTHIHSYLNIPDTSGRDSLFQAESRRCKEIIDIINEYSGDKYRHFCIFDELYSGTNPIEATKSAYSFLLYLCKFNNVNFILTTHYVDICKKFRKSENVQNYKMAVEIGENGNIQYTYKMKKGISRIQGAVKILEQMNYPKEIIDCIKNYKR